MSENRVHVCEHTRASCGPLLSSLEGVARQSLEEGLGVSVGVPGLLFLGALRGRSPLDARSVVLGQGGR